MTTRLLSIVCGFLLCAGCGQAPDNTLSELSLELTRPTIEGLSSTDQYEESAPSGSLDALVNEQVSTLDDALPYYRCRKSRQAKVVMSIDGAVVFSRRAKATRLADAMPQIEDFMTRVRALRDRPSAAPHTSPSDRSARPGRTLRRKRLDSFR